jgi:hypothetical protein
MKNLLNNRWIIIGLSVTALFMLVRSITQPFLDKPEFSDDIGSYDWLDDTSTASKSVSRSTALKSISNSTIFWNTHPRRDPFSQHVLINSHDVLAIQSQAQAKLGDIRDRQLILSALVAGPVSKYAVINGRIIQEGDRIGDYRVSQIVHDGVWLNSGANRYKLNLKDKIR